MARKRLLLGIDLGTSYFKLGLFDAQGALHGLGRVRVDKQVPLPGRSELPVEGFWGLLQRALGSALTEAQAEPGDIAALSYSSQANTFLLLDQTRALTPLIFWTDERADPMPAAAAAFAESEDFANAIGFKGVNPQMAVAKWRWLRQHRPELWREATSVMTLADYFVFALTGERVGDASTAAFLGLYDLNRHRWWTPALEQFEVPATLLSEPLLPGTHAGYTTPRAMELLGLPAHLPMAVGALDHYAAALGSGVGRLADASISTGTVLAALTLVDHVNPAGGCYHGPQVGGNGYYRLAFDMGGAGQLEEYQARVRPELSLEKLLALATVSQVVERDQTDGMAVRRILEGIADRHRELIARITPTPVERVVATGGGARSPLLLQLTANIVGAPVVTTRCPERACLGAAMFAAVAAGWNVSVQDAGQIMVREASLYSPETRSRT